MLLNITTPDRYKKLETIINKKEPVLVLYRASWCHFCHDFQPTWNNFTKTAKIKTAEIESSDLGLTKSPEHQVSSYPTLKLFVNGKVIHFDQDRNIDNINKFVSMHVKVVKKPKTVVKSKPKAKPKSKPKK